jgi:hypothetical protein
VGQNDTVARRPHERHPDGRLSPAVGDELLLERKDRSAAGAQGAEADRDARDGEAAGIAHGEDDLGVQGVPDHSDEEVRVRRRLNHAEREPVLRRRRRRRQHNGERGGEPPNRAPHPRFLPASDAHGRSRPSENPKCSLSEGPSVKRNLHVFKDLRRFGEAQGPSSSVPSPPIKREVSKGLRRGEGAI